MSSAHLGRAAVALVAAAALSLFLGAPAARSVSAGPAGPAGPERPAPRPATFTIEGNGYGHGHGLSQHGAQSAAQQGRTHRQILDFYYPGLTRSTAGGTMSVLVSADTSQDVVVSARPGLKVTGRSTPSTTVVLDRPGATRWRITPAAGGASSTISFKDGRWTKLRSVKGDAQFSAGGPITLHTPAGTVTYRGVLRSATPGSGPAGGSGRDTVNVVPLDSYLRGVVPREVPALWHPQAVQAQAVAARTYAAFERREPLAGHYQVCDTSSCQVYGGQSAEHPASDRAIAATRGQVLTSGGRPAFTQFSASNGGWSSAGSRAYLPAQRDPYDTSYRRWRVALSSASLQRAFPSLGTVTAVKPVQRDGNGAWGGRVERIQVVGSDRTAVVTGDVFRTIFGLRSTWFRVL